MEFRRLGRTELSVSLLGFGAGPISGLMVGANRDEQAVCVGRALQHGINWFDTAAAYGDGRSEESLGLALRAAAPRNAVHIATKVRLNAEDLSDIRGAIERSVESSLRRLDVSSVTLLQLHNGITSQRGEIPSSLTAKDVLNAVADTMESLREQGLIRHLGLTGTGGAETLREVVRSRRFDTLQIPFHLANPTAIFPRPDDFGELDHCQLVRDCQQADMGVFAIRVFAGGALLGRPPSPHTFRTPYFPLDLFRRDELRAKQFLSSLPAGMTLAEAAIRFAIGPDSVSSVLIGFSGPVEIDEAIRHAAKGALDPLLTRQLIQRLSDNISGDISDEMS